LGNIGYQGQDAIFGAVYAHKGGAKKLKRHGLHGFALDQPSINGIGPINRSENMKRSETECDLRLFPTVSPWTPLDLQKKNGFARKCLFKRNAG